MVLNQGVSSKAPLALWISPVAEIGGVGRHFIDVASAGIPNFALAFLVPEGALAQALRAKGATVYVGDFGVDNGLLASARAVSSLAKKLGPAVVHSHLAYADIALAASRLPRGTVRISSEHGIAAPDIYQSGLRAAVMKQVHHLRTARFASIIAVSKSTAEVMQRNWKPLAPVTLIYNGVDAPVKSGARPKHLTVLSLARLSHEKRIGALISGFAALLEQRPDARLVIAGAGPDEGDLRDQVRNLAIADSVTFAGFVDAAQALDNASVLVQLSKWENCSYSLLDAKVRGLGIVATAVGGNPEIVEQASLLDSLEPQAIAAAIIAQEAGNAATKWLSVAEMCTLISAHYTEVVSR